MSVHHIVEKLGPILASKTQRYLRSVGPNGTAETADLIRRLDFILPGVATATLTITTGGRRMLPFFQTSFGRREVGARFEFASLRASFEARRGNGKVAAPGGSNAMTRDEVCEEFARYGVDYSRIARPDRAAVEAAKSREKIIAADPRDATIMELRRQLDEQSLRIAELEEAG